MNNERRASLEMLICAMLWSLSGVLTKLVDWNPLVISAGRSALAAIVVLLYMRYLKLKPVLNKRTMALGACVAATFLCYLPAIKLTSSANAIVLQYTAPIYVLAFSAIFYKQPVKRGDIIAVAATVAGIALCFVKQFGAGSFLGNALALCSGVTLSGMFLLTGGLDEQERLSGMLIAQLLAVLAGLPFVLTGGYTLNIRDISLVVLQGVIQLGIPYILYTRAARHCPPLKCSLISVIEPLLNPVWVFLAIGENPGIFSFMGSVIVLFSVTIWCIWTEKQKSLVEEIDGV